MPKHIHADLLSEYARLSHITDRPWEYFEVKYEVNGEWEFTSTANPPNSTPKHLFP